MSWKYIKDSLPWLVPSAAIVFAGAGFLDYRNDAAEQAAPSVQYVTQPAPAEPIDIEAEEMVARQDSGLEALATAAVPTEEPLAALPAPTPEPEPEPVQRQAALVTTTPDTSFFGSAQVEEARAQCLEDLRNLANQVRVYFPSGGLTASDSGIEGGRLLGLVAQSCPGVQIMVEGHSDPSGDPLTNLQLSEQRAQQVITRIAASGIDTSMFVAVGKGESEPSNISGSQPSWYYDRRVEFSIVDMGTVTPVAARVVTRETPWANAACVQELERAVSATMLFYPKRSVSVRADEFETAMSLANMAMQCPHARLRVIGHHSGEVQAGETIATGILRAQALMSMLVARGVAAEQIIIAAPSRAGGIGDDRGLPGSRVEFDIILEDG